jgi:hypothetical protein
MTKPRNKPTPKPRIVYKWAPKIATLVKSIDLEKREEVWL